MKINSIQGKEAAIDLLYDELKSAEKNKSRLIVFHGPDRSVNSALCGRLYEKTREEKNIVCALLDFKIPSNRETDGFLITLRNHINKEFGVVFPSFDLACAYYLYKTNPSLSPISGNFPLIEGKGPLKSAIRAISGLPVKSFMPELNRVFTTPGSRYKQWWQKRGKSELVNLTSLEPEQILKSLAGLWIEDFNEFLTSNGAEALLFMDAFEYLLQEIDSDHSGLYERFLMKCIRRIDKIRFAVISDLEFKNGNGEIEIDFDVKNIAVDDFIDRRSSEYLIHTGIADEKLAAFIEKECAGTPYLLNLAIDIHREIMNNGTREPNLDDFNSLFKNAGEKLFAVLAKEESYTLKILSCSLNWNNNLLLSLVDKFGTGYLHKNSNAILRFSFINSTGLEGYYAMDENIRRLFAADMEKELSAEVYKFLFEYHDELLKFIDYKNITDIDKNNFRSAFYSAVKVMNALELAVWSSPYFDGFRENGRYGFILPFLNEVNAAMEKDNIEDSKEFAAMLQHTGICYKEIGRYKDSERLLNKAVRITEKIYGKDSKEVAGCFLSMADTLFCQGEFSKAEPLYLKSIVLLNPLGEKEGTSSVGSMINLAILYARQGNYDKAVSVFEKILSIRLKSHGDEHPDVHRILTNIANIEFERKNYDKAESIYRKILLSKKSYYGDYHPEVGKAMINLGNVLIELGNYGETISLYEKAKEIFEEFYGREHPDYAMTLNNLAYLNFLTGSFDTSKIFYLQALDIYKNILGGEHPDLAILYNNIGVLYTRMKEFTEAEIYLKKSLEINVKKFGFDKPGTGSSYKSLAEFNESIGNIKEALYYYEKYESILKAHFPKDNPDIKTVRVKIASLKK